jgi:GDP-mannose 6-dehydrogenase
MEGVARTGRFTATTDAERAVLDSDLAFVCVGTPSNGNGSLCLDVVRRVSEQIGASLAKKQGYFVVAVRSTVLPGTVESEVIPRLEQHSGKRAGVDFGVCMVPEFLREGTSVEDFFHPPKSVVGEFDERSGNPVAEIFRAIDAPIVRTPLRIAEMVKYTDNTFHALKVTFANEIGNICKELNCDSHRVMDIFCLDQKLNLSPYYLKPGFAFGGSCLPKDVRAIVYKSRTLDVNTPVIGSILESNQNQIDKVIKQLSAFKGRSLGFLGLSFKHGTDDLRESPIATVVETMLGKGFSIRIYDQYVSVARLVGANKEYIEKEIPHLSSLMCDSAAELIRRSDVIIVGNRSEEFRDALVNEAENRHVVLDLVRIVGDQSALKAQYHGLCW